MTDAVDRHPPVALVTVAHPDDESFGCGTTIAWLAARGFRVVVCCASRGEAGEDARGLLSDPVELGRLRQTEFTTAARALGVSDTHLLDFADSGWEGPAPDDAIIASHRELVGVFAGHMAALRPTVVVTMDPTGSDGHRDHAAVGRATTEAFTATVAWDAGCYHWCLPRSLMVRWVAAESGRDPDSVYLEVEMGRPDAEITTVLDGRPVRDRVESAIACHATQRSPYADLSAELRDAFLDADHLVRVAPFWTGGATETALYSGPTPFSAPPEPALP